ncbi:hypothetical protein WT58_24070 [Burkholderia territorii]|uniref:hypothetical protein n=1 Tax=Burkholderia territorii TaxID=1503055 RepID=UPI00076CEE15|nr:hypothetical protein [Burkholderia territorii]KWH03714.1 hypothetical protein WT58_24070 [Burkholderia territorii]
MLAKDAQIGMLVVANADKGQFKKGDKFYVKDIEPGAINDPDRILTLEPHPDNKRIAFPCRWFAWRVDPLIQDEWIVNDGTYIPRAGDVVRFRDMVNAAKDVRNQHPWWVVGMDRFSGKEVVIEAISHADRMIFQIEGGEGYSFGAQWVEAYKRAGAVAAAPIRFEKGDWVKVTKQHVDGKLKYLVEVDATIGQVFKVKAFDERTNTYLLDNGYSYLVQSLTKATDEEVKAKKAKKPSLSAVIAKARKELIPQVIPSCCNFVVFTQNNDGTIETHDETAAPCHAALDKSYLAGHKRVGVDYRVVGVLDLLHDYTKQIDKKYHGAYKKYVDWMVNHSPWSIAYQRKSVKNILDNGVLLDVTKPAVVVGGACISLRFMKEFCQYLPLYERLLKAGIERDAAYLTAYSFDAVARKKNEFTIGTMYGGHQVLCATMRAGGVLSLMANGFDEKTLEIKSYAVAPTYRGIQENISNTKDVLGIKDSWSQYVLKTVPFKVEKAGWAEVRKCTWDDVLAFGKHVQEQIHKARELKANAIINEQKAAA